MNHTLDNVDVFPEGTSVGCYLAADNPGSSSKPLGSAVDTRTMTAGTLTFIGLTSGVAYAAFGQVSGAWRRLDFTADAAVHDPIYTDTDATLTADYTFSGDVTFSGTVAGISGSVYDVQEYGALGDGTTDDTDAINAAIVAANAAGGGTVFLSPCAGGYGVTCDANPIILLSNVTIEGSGYAGRIKRIGTYEKYVGRRIFSALDTTNGISHSTLRNIYVDGQTSSVTLTSTQLNGALAGGETTITVDSTTNFPSAGEILIGTTQYSYTSKTSTTFVGLSPAASAAADNTVVYESVGNLTSQLIRYYPLDAGEHHQYIRVEDCEFVDWPGAVLHLDDVEYFVCRGNIVRNAQRGGLVLFHDCHHGVINDNDVHAADDCIAVQANSNTATVAKGTGPAYVTISGNTCESFGITNQFTNNCLNIQGLVDSTISGNTCIGAGETGGTNKAGIRLSLSDGAASAARYSIRRVNVTGNTVYSPHGHGIYVPPDSVTAEPAEDLHIANNQVIDAYDRAIFLDGYVNRVSIVGNSIYNSNAGAGGSMDAIRLDDVHSFLVQGNRIVGPAAQCRYGINVASGSTNGLVANNYAPDSSFSSRAFENSGGTTCVFRDNEAGAIGSVGSAATVTLRDGYDVTVITGTTGITSITAEHPGRIVTLKFAAALTLTDGSNLKLNGNFVTTADDTITLVCDGTDWIELARSAN